MENSLTRGVVDVCKVLNKHSVRYLLVGGIAVGLHGYFRLTMTPEGLPADKHDLDFWYDPTYTNYFNLLNALEELGHDVTFYKEEQSPNPRKSFFKFESEKFTLDFLPELKGLAKFSTSFMNKEIVNLNGTEIGFINYEDLIKDKQVNPRPKDLTDIEQLKNRRNEQE